MQFNSLAFLIFFVLFFFVYYSARKLWTQNAFLLVASFFFYGYWDWRFLSLIGISVLSTYSTALLAEKGRRRLWTILNICLNLAILCTFKYFNFFAENLILLFNTFGVALDYPTVNVLLPVGISFYTFQAISYSVDVYRRDIAPERNLVSFALYICYFPQLVAGPIERASKLLPQINRERSITYPQLVGGMRQALWGLFKKVVVADGCVHYVDKYFVADFSPAGAVTATVAALLFSVQIYCDFSGYCDIARGVSQMLGIKIMQNFEYPYFSKSVQEFWRRWNISLMKWFRDYLYIPLGGSHRGNVRTYLNLFIVFLVSGLWHGASWNFVLWGAYWGLVMVAYRYLHGINRNQTFVDSIASNKEKGRDILSLTGTWSTLTLAMMGWVIFRSEGLQQTVDMLSLTCVPVSCLTATLCFAVYLWSRLSIKARRFVLGTIAVAFIAILCLHPYLVVKHVILLYIVCMFAVEWIGRRDIYPLQQMPRNRVFRYALYYLMILLILVNVHGSAQFIYFKF